MSRFGRRRGAATRRSAPKALTPTAGPPGRTPTTRLAERYRDLSDPTLAQAADSWRSAGLVRIVIEAERVTRFRG